MLAELWTCMGYPRLHGRRFHCHTSCCYNFPSVLDHLQLSSSYLRLAVGHLQTVFFNRFFFTSDWFLRIRRHFISVQGQPARSSNNNHGFISTRGFRAWHRLVGKRAICSTIIANNSSSCTAVATFRCMSDRQDAKQFFTSLDDAIKYSDYFDLKDVGLKFDLIHTALTELSARARGVEAATLAQRKNSHGIGSRHLNTYKKRVERFECTQLKCEHRLTKRLFSLQSPTPLSKTYVCIYI